jgi:hypothetical protein
VSHPLCGVRAEHADAEPIVPVAINQDIGSAAKVRFERRRRFRVAQPDVRHGRKCRCGRRPINRNREQDTAHHPTGVTRRSGRAREVSPGAAARGSLPPPAHTGRRSEAGYGRARAGVRAAQRPRPTGRESPQTPATTAGASIWVVAPPPDRRQRVRARTPRPAAAPRPTASVRAALALTGDAGRNAAGADCFHRTPPCPGHRGRLCRVRRGAPRRRRSPSVAAAALSCSSPRRIGARA